MSSIPDILQVQLAGDGGGLAPEGQARARRAARASGASSHASHRAATVTSTRTGRPTGRGRPHRPGSCRRCGGPASARSHRGRRGALRTDGPQRGLYIAFEVPREMILPGRDTLTFQVIHLDSDYSPVILMVDSALPTAAIGMTIPRSRGVPSAFVVKSASSKPMVYLSASTV